ncbi:intermembrane phospholipid transport protein YdbH family protein [Oceanimonas baumannii]|uniref:intermembrane phospholipid transport protein YdbH family protein n=1 Tax=Oceanimonas baumannii TaxID=129578 RepID=UPI003A8F4A82
MMMRVLLGLLLCLPGVVAAALPAGLELTAQMERASVPACPREQARQLELHWRNGEVSGSLDYLGLDLACSRSGNQGAQGESDALSLLLTLPPVDFSIEHFMLHLPDRELSGPARLRHRDGDIIVHWQAENGPLSITLTPEQGGWRWRGELPGNVLLPSLSKPVSMQGYWQPGQGLQVAVDTALPEPLTGRLSLDGQLNITADGWQWDPASRLTIDRLSWRQLRLNELVLQPAGALPLTGIGHWILRWQGGHWQQQHLPGAQLTLALDDHRHGTITLELDPKLKVRTDWRWQEGLALTLPQQSLSLAKMAAWLNRWITLPELDVEQGELALSGRAENVLDGEQPLTLTLALKDGRLRRGELYAQGVKGQVEVVRHNGQLSLGRHSGLTIAELNTGVPVTNIHGSLSWRDNSPWLSGLTANVLDGRLALSPMKLSTHLRGELHLQDISLARLLNLSAVPGLTGDGSLHGRLPFVLNDRISVQNGRLWGYDGWVSYQAGESLTETAADNLSLGLTLGMLKDLRYDRLNADMSMSEDGEAIIMTRLQGRAPVGGQLHPVNFNYRHQENLLQLLASLRFAEQLSERLPARLQGGTE